MPGNRRHLPMLLTLATLLLARIGTAGAPTMPPLTDDGAARQLPGKFVWADLATPEYARARDFYTALFDLEWRELSPPPEAYGLLLKRGHPVAGIAEHRPPARADATSHWVHFMSVTDVEEALRSTRDAGGDTLLGVTALPERGTVAIARGLDGEVFGLIDTAQRDPEDHRAVEGGWMWRELLTDRVEASAALLRQLCGCSVAPGADDAMRYFVSSAGYLRGAVSPLPGDADHAVWLGFVHVDDLETRLARARSLGAEVLVSPEEAIAAGPLAVVRDPTGAVFGMLEWEYSAETDR